MNIAITSPWFLPLVGGTQTLVHSLATGLGAIGDVQVTVLTGKYPQSIAGQLSSASVSLPFELRRFELQSEGSAAHTQNENEEECFVLQDMEAAVKELQPDVVLYTPHAGSFGWQAYRAATLTGARFAIWPAIHLNNLRHISVSARSLYARADYAFANTAVEAEWMIQHAGIPTERVVLTGCGYRLQRYVPNAEMRKTCSTKDHCAILSVGQIRRHKRYDLQLRALAMARRCLDCDLTLTIAGGESDDMPSLLEMAQSMGVAGRVRIVLNLTDRQIDEFYSDADIFLFTSEEESFGIAVLDAIAAGVYPVVLPHPAYGEMVKSAGFGRVSPEMTAESLASEIEAAIRTGECWLPRPEQCSSWLAEHSWNVVAQKVALAFGVTGTTFDAHMAGSGDRYVEPFKHDTGQS